MLKKKYYELALKLHPDKCKAPGAAEAFKGYCFFYLLNKQIKFKQSNFF